jgi:hypothetical protein
MKLNKTNVQKAIATLMWGTMVVTSVAPSVVYSANNRLSNVVKAPVSNGFEEYLDLTLNVDWDYDANVTQRGTGVGEVPARTLNRAYIDALVRQTARTLFVMTNGKHRIGKVYVFKNSKFGSDVDIRVLNVPGRANANISGWRADGGLTTNNYITNEVSGGGLDPESPEQTGEVIAHELGHYVYGLLDEYREAGSACKDPAEQLGSPCQDDLVKPTVMNDQSRSYRLSVPSDYAGTPAFRTAQARGYGAADGSNSSGWEMLTRDPASDSENAKKETGGRRIRFDAFKDIPVPTVENLKTFTSDGELSRFDQQRGAVPAGSVFAGYDKYLQVIYEGEAGSTATASKPRNVLVIDRTVASETFAQIITAAKGLVDRAPDNARFALVTSPSAGTPQLMEMTAAGKSALKDALDALTQTTGEFDIAQAYEAGKALVVQARPAAGQPAEDAGNTDTFSLYTKANSSVPENLGEQARSDKIAFNVVAFMAQGSSASRPVAARSLAQLAKDSGGTNNTARSANEAIKEADKALKAAMGMTEALMTAGLSDEVIKAGTTFETPFRVGSQANDGKVIVRFYFSEKDRSKLSFSCAPVAGGAGGVVVVEPSEPDVEEGLATCTIDGNRVAGNWVAKATVASGRGDAELIESEIVSVANGTPIEVNASIEGGTAEDPKAPVLLVSFGGQFPIVNANIAVEIYDANTGNLVKELKLTGANDQATNGDARANDGVYTLNLANQLNAGDYFVVIEAVTDATNSMFNPVQRFANGLAPNAKPVGEVVSRLAEGEFFLEQGQPGVGVASTPTTPTTPVATSGSGGGGCTTGGGSDFGLLALLALASGRLAMSLRRRRK